MDSLWTERSTQIVLVLVGVLVVMRLVLLLAPADSAAARLVLWFWHPDARGEGPLDNSIHPLTVQNMDSTLLALLVVFCVVRPCVLQAFYIPSQSMEPTLWGSPEGRKDRVLVNKYIYWLRAPRRGEILVFHAPLNATDGQKQDFIKRLIGLPGDVVEVHNHHAFINGQPLYEPYLNHFGGGLSTYSEFGPVTVPQGQYFMMGDNRGNSKDSRWWGCLPAENVLGKAMCVFWPPVWPMLAPDPDFPDAPRRLALRLLH
jgi:signal peptidase I